MVKVLENQIDELLIKDYQLYKDGKMREDNFNALLDCLTMVFGAEYIGQRMIELKISKKP